MLAQILKPTTRKGNTKRVTVNLAIEEDTFNEIKKEAKLRDYSINALMNNILTKHVNIYRHATDLGCVIWSPGIFLSFLDLMDEYKIIEIIKNEGVQAVKSYFAHKGIPLTKDSLIKYALEGIAMWTGQYSFFTHYVDNDGYTCLVFNHKFGLKWSRILKSLHSVSIEELLNYPVQGSIKVVLCKCPRSC